MQGQTPGTGKSNFTANQASNQSGQSNGATSKGYETYDQARQKTGEVIDQVQEKTGQMVDQVREQATSQLSSQKDRVAEGMGNVAHLIRMTGDQMRQNNQEGVAQFTDQAANRVENFSRFLQDREPGEIVREVENFARREPVLFLGGAFTLVLLAARFLKSSNPTSQSDQNTNTLARRQGYGTTSATSAPLTPPPVTGTGQQYGGDRTTNSQSQNAGSTIARHFGEASAAGQDEMGKPRTQRQDSGMSDVDVL